MIKLFTRLYQRRAWDLSGVASKEHRNILQGALDACDYPFYRIKKATGKRVPVSTGDLSRWSAALSQGNGHAHVHNHATGEKGHVLGVAHKTPAEGGPGGLAVLPRFAALGLFWLPTAEHPAGRVEIDTNCFTNPDLARIVFLAEGAHAVDYGVMTDQQRLAILQAYASEHHDPDGVDDWFEEHGEDDYWSWIGESFMSGFTRAFAPSLADPLEPRQPWIHRTTPGITALIREVMK